MNNESASGSAPPSVPLFTSLSLLLTRRRLLAWSLVLVLVTIVFTWLGFLLTTGLLDQLTEPFFDTAPGRDRWWGWPLYIGWVIAKYLFLLVSRIVAFFLAFIIAYTLTTPFYSFLSEAAEKLYWGDEFEPDGGFTVAGIIKDLVEGLKVGAFGIVVTIAALAVGFVPIVGQVSVFLLYTYYCALMFIDYPASRRRWGLGDKLLWLRHHSGHGLRLGLLPAVVTMVPFVNVFLMAFIFPLFTVHAALNFSAVQHFARRRPPVPPSDRRG